jgi:hypothetical protein
MFSSFYPNKPIDWKTAEDCQRFWETLVSTTHLDFHHAYDMLQKFYILKHSEASWGSKELKIEKLKNYAHRYQSDVSIAFQLMNELEQDKPHYPTVSEEGESTL